MATKDTEYDLERALDSLIEHAEQIDDESTPLADLIALTVEIQRASLHAYRVALKADEQIKAGR